jgi:hypothetical protein
MRVSASGGQPVQADLAGRDASRAGPPFPVVPSRRRALPVHVASGRSRRLRHLHGLARIARGQEDPDRQTPRRPTRSPAISCSGNPAR